MFWERSTSKIVGKVDNDMIMPKNWLKRLYKAFVTANDIDIFGSCTLFPEDIDEKSARRRARDINGIKLLQEEYIGGCYIANGDMLRKIGLRSSKISIQRAGPVCRLIFSERVRLLAFFTHLYLWNIWMTRGASIACV